MPCAELGFIFDSVPFGVYYIKNDRGGIGFNRQTSGAAWDECAWRYSMWGCAWLDYFVDTLYCNYSVCMDRPGTNDKRPD